MRQPKAKTYASAMHAWTTIVLAMVIGLMAVFQSQGAGENSSFRGRVDKATPIGLQVGHLNGKQTAKALTDKKSKAEDKAADAQSSTVTEWVTPTVIVSGWVSDLHWEGLGVALLVFATLLAGLTILVFSSEPRATHSRQLVVLTTRIAPPQAP